MATLAPVLGIAVSRILWADPHLAPVPGPVMALPPAPPEYWRQRCRSQHVLCASGLHLPPCLISDLSSFP